MDLYANAVPLEVEVIVKIIKSIETANYICNEEFEAYDFLTNNGEGGMRWNFTNREIARVLEGSKFQIVVLNRGWKLIGIYDKQTKYFYTLMRNKNFISLRKSASKKLMHYLNALSRLNARFVGKYDLLEEQLVLGEEFVPDEHYYEKLDSVLKALVKDIHEPIETYALITFEMQYGQVSKLECLIPSVGMNYFARENWTEYIGVACESSTVSSHIEANCTSDDAGNIEDDNGEPLLRRKGRNKQIAK